MITLKVGDRLRCKHFVYVRDTSAGFIFDYRDYWFNEDGSWNKDVIPREEMEGRIKDDPTNADAWFEVIDVEEAPGGRIHNDIIEPYSLYLLKKVGDNSHPRITIATDGIDRRYFNLGLTEIEYGNNNWVGKVEMLTVANIIDKYGYLMTQEELKSLKAIYPVKSDDNTSN